MSQVKLATRQKSFLEYTADALDYPSRIAHVKYYRKKNLCEKNLHKKYITGNKYRIDYTQEWVMRLCNPRVCGYPEAEPRDKCKQVGYSA